MFFFFKQKTAYEMRISDWSSDVCSSDLSGDALVHAFNESTGRSPHRYPIERRTYRAKELLVDPKLSTTEIGFALGFASQSHFTTQFRRPRRHARDRKSVVEGKSVSERVGLGGRGFIKKNKKTHKQ